MRFMGHKLARGTCTINTSSGIPLGSTINIVVILSITALYVVPYVIMSFYYSIILLCTIYNAFTSRHKCPFGFKNKVLP